MDSSSTKQQKLFKLNETYSYAGLYIWVKFSETIELLL